MTLSKLIGHVWLSDISHRNRDGGGPGGGGTDGGGGFVAWLDATISVGSSISISFCNSFLVFRQKLFFVLFLLLLLLFQLLLLPLIVHYCSVNDDFCSFWPCDYRPIPLSIAEKLSTSDLWIHNHVSNWIWQLDDWFISVSVNPLVYALVFTSTKVNFASYSGLWNLQSVKFNPYQVNSLIEWGIPAEAIFWSCFRSDDLSNVVIVL